MSNSVDRRRFLAGIGATGLALVAAPEFLAACASPSRSSNSQGKGARTNAGISVALTAEPRALNPIQFNDNSTLAVCSLICESLYSLDANFNLVPVLASALPKTNADFTRFEIPLRSGVQFHNGKKLTSADVAYTVTTITSGKYPSSIQSAFTFFKSVETPNDQTVVINLSAPAQFLLEYVTLQGLLIVPSNIEYNPATYGLTGLVGTGPFKFSEWQHNVELVVSRNEKYWQKGLPYLANVSYQIIPTPANQLIGLRNGSIQLVPGISGSQVKVAQQDKLSLYHPESVRSLDWMWASLQPERPTSNFHVRQAITYAINRQRIVEEVYGGLARAETTIPSYPERGYDAALAASIPATGDPARAKQALAAAGNFSSAPITLVAPNSYPTALPMAELIKEDLSAVGLVVAIQSVSLADSLTDLQTAQYDLLWFSQALSYPIPTAAVHFDLPTSSSNWNHVNNANLTRLAAAAYNDPSQTPALQREYLALLPQIPLTTEPAVFLVDKRLENFVANQGAGNLSSLTTARLA